jgi:prepilin signal peptidase PulO-like enzyme (type II secretory pathway)
MAISMSNMLSLAALAVTGLSLGSFANAAVWRLKERRDIVHERSECVHCHHQLAWYDLIPVVSWLSLQGKCRYCGKPISWQYPLVEMAVALYFILSLILWPYRLESWAEVVQFIVWLGFGLGLAILFVYDLRWYLLPDRVVYPLIGLASISFIIREAFQQPFDPVHIIIQLILALVPLAGFYYVLHVISKGQWVGFGDVKLGVFMGIALGWQLALLTLMVANILACLVTIPGLILKKINPKSRIPFGPFLIAGFIISGLFGGFIIEWYMGDGMGLFIEALML